MGMMYAVACHTAMYAPYHSILHQCSAHDIVTVYVPYHSILHQCSAHDIVTVYVPYHSILHQCSVHDIATVCICSAVAAAHNGGLTRLQPITVYVVIFKWQ